MIIPSCNSKDPQINQLFRLVDEKLSELYALHGKAQIRSEIVFDAPPTYPTSNRSINSNSLVKAFLFYDGSNQEIIHSYNINKVENLTPGSYQITVTKPTNTDYPIVLVNADTAGAYWATKCSTYKEGSTQRFIVQVHNLSGGIETEAYIKLAVFGD